MSYLEEKTLPLDFFRKVILIICGTKKIFQILLISWRK